MINGGCAANATFHDPRALKLEADADNPKIYALKEFEGFNLLHFSLMSTSPSINLVRYLIKDVKVEVDHQDLKLKTPLHHCI